MEVDKLKRVDWIDVAKGIGILIVLTFHASSKGSFIKNFLWQMHMPMFAFLSGFVYDSKYSSNIYSLKLFVTKRIKSIYLPFVSYSLVFLAFHNFFYRINFIGPINGNKILSVGGYLRQAVLILTLGGGESLTGALWYLIPLLELEILFSILIFLFEKIKMEKYRDILVFLTCIVLYITFANMGLPRNLSNAVRLMLFYCGGYYCKKYDLMNIINKYQRVITFVILLGVWINCTSYSPSWQSENLLVAALSACAGIYCVLNISRALSECKLKKLVGGLKHIGRKTMPIVAWHFLMYCFVKIVYVFVNDLEHSLIATKEAITDPKWIGVYVLVGLLGSLVVDYIIENVKKILFKVESRVYRGDFE